MLCPENMTFETIRENMNEHPSHTKSTNGASSVDDESSETEYVADDVLRRDGEKTVRFSHISAVFEKLSQHSSENADDDAQIDEPQDCPQTPPKPERRQSTSQRFQSDEERNSTPKITLPARVIPLFYKSATSAEDINFQTSGIERDHDCLLNKKHGYS